MPVGRLIATAFIPNPNHYTEVLFINGNKEDCSLGNLKWFDSIGAKAEKARLARQKTNIANKKRDMSRRVLLFKDGEYVHTFDSIVQCVGYLQVAENKLQYKFSSIRKYVMWARERKEPLWGHYTFAMEKDLPPDSDLLRVTE